MQNSRTVIIEKTHYGTDFSSVMGAIEHYLSIQYFLLENGETKKGYNIDIPSRWFENSSWVKRILIENGFKTIKGDSCGSYDRIKIIK